MIICLVLGFVVLYQKAQHKKGDDDMDLWSKRLLTGSKPSLKYACYLIIKSGAYAYAKVPLGSSLTQYTHKDGSLSIATSSAQLMATDGKWISVSEDKATWYSIGISESPRYTAGDIYE